MEEDVKPKDEDGVVRRGVCGWDGWVGGLGAVGASPIFGLVRRAGAFCCGASDFSFRFKNASRATVPWQWPLPQRSVFFTNLRQWSVAPW